MGPPLWWLWAGLHCPARARPRTLGLPPASREHVHAWIVTWLARLGPSRPEPGSRRHGAHTADGGPQLLGPSTLAARGLQTSSESRHLPSLCRLAETTAPLAKGLPAGGLSAFSLLTAYVPFRYSGHELRSTQNLLPTPVHRCPGEGLV